MKHLCQIVAGFVFGMTTIPGLSAQAVASGSLADGQYDCDGGYTYRHMGMVDRKGDQFRYRPFDDPVSGFAPYSEDASGMIRWGGHFGGLDDPPARITESTREKFGFNVKYQGTPGGSINTMSCHAPGK